METKFKIYTQKTITNQDGTTQNILNQVGSATREELVKMYVDNYFEEGIGAGAVLRKLDESRHTKSHKWLQ